MKNLLVFTTLTLSLVLPAYADLIEVEVTGSLTNNQVKYANNNINEMFNQYLGEQTYTFVYDNETDGSGNFINEGYYTPHGTTVPVNDGFYAELTSEFAISADAPAEVGNFWAYNFHKGAFNPENASFELGSPDSYHMIYVSLSLLDETDVAWEAGQTGLRITERYGNGFIEGTDFQITYLGDVRTSSVPEPSIITLLLSSIGILGAGALSRRKK